MTSTLDYALRYRMRNMPVLPIWPALKFERGFTCGCGKGTRCAQPGKHPLAALVRHGSKDASLDEKKIKDWFTVWPNANVAIATGNRLVVLDIDPRHGGDLALAKLEAEYGALPQTWRVKTGGGVHLYFRTPPDIIIKNNVGALGAGLDIRSQGGFAIAPPSRHFSGGIYEWEIDTGEIASLPSWLIIAKTTTTKAAPVETWRELARDGVAEGKRNNAATRLTGYLLRHYVDPLVVLELVQSWNIAKCSPPLEPEEIETVVDSVCGLELERRRAAS
jgi:hypothetical protein